MYKKVYRERLKRSKWGGGIKRNGKFGSIGRVHSLYPAKFSALEAFTGAALARLAGLPGSKWIYFLFFIF
jgi:hypothetical protein